MPIIFLTLFACVLYLIVAAIYYGFRWGTLAQLERFEERWEAGQQIGEAVVEEKKLLGQSE